MKTAADIIKINQSLSGKSLSDRAEAISQYINRAIITIQDLMSEGRDTLKQLKEILMDLKYADLLDDGTEDLLIKTAGIVHHLTEV